MTSDSGAGPSAPAAGQTFGSAELTEPLARGVTSVLWRARRFGAAGFERPVCVKVIDPSLAADPGYAAAFEEEARTLLGLAPQGIVPLYEIGAERGQLWLIIELLDGADLVTLLAALARAERRVPTALACHLLVELGAALGTLHGATGPDGEPMAHGDVAPGHAMLTADGIVRLLDPVAFRAVLRAPPSPRTLRGTAPYLAPEQAEGGPATPASDVRAFGALACEILTGAPWTDPDGDGLVEAIGLEPSDARGRGLDRHAVARDVVGPLGQELARALEPWPEDRPSIGVLVSALARAHRALDPGAGSRAAARLLAEARTASDPDADRKQAPRAASRGRADPTQAVPPGAEAQPQPRARSFGPSNKHLLTTAPQTPLEEDSHTSAAAPPADPSLPFGPPVVTPDPTVTPRPAAGRAPAPQPDPESPPPRWLPGRDPEVSDATYESERAWMSQPGFGPEAYTIEASRADVPRPRFGPPVATLGRSADDPGATLAPAVASVEANLADIARPASVVVVAAPRRFGPDVSTDAPSVAIERGASPPEPADPATVARVPDPRTALDQPTTARPRGEVRVAARGASRNEPRGGSGGSARRGDEAPVIDEATTARPPGEAQAARAAQGGSPRAARRAAEHPVISDARHDDARDDDAHDDDADRGYAETPDPAPPPAPSRARSRMLGAPTHAPPPPAPVLDERRPRLAIAALLDGVPDARRRRAHAGLAQLAERLGLRLADTDEYSFGALLGDGPRAEPEDSIALRFASLAAHAAALPPASLAIGIRAGATAASTDGDAVARAKDLARLAPPGGTLLAGSASRASHVRWALGEQHDLAIPALLLERVHPADARRRQLLATRGTLVGRNQELATLADALDGVVRRRATEAVGITAPPGAGATRLAAELAARAHERRIAIVVVDPPPAAAGTPFATILELAAGLLGLVLQPGLATRPSLVEAARKAYDQRGLEELGAAGHVAALAEALLALGGEGEATAGIEARLAAALSALLDATRRDRSRLVLLDGWHRADLESRRVITQLLALDTEGPTLFVLTSAPSIAGEPLHLPGEHGGVELVPVDASTAAAIARAHHGEPVNRDARARLLARAGGLPALITALDDAGTPPGQEVEAVLDAAAAALSPAARAALQRIALLAPRTPAWLLATELGAVGLAPRATSRAAESLIAFGLVARATGGALELAAGVIGEVTLARLSPDARRIAEGRLADAIAAARAAGEEVPAELDARRQAWASAPRPHALGQAAAALDADDAAVAAATFRSAIADAPDEDRRAKALLGLEDAAFALGDLATSAETLAALEASAGTEVRADLRRRTARRALIIGPVSAALAAAQAAERAATLSGEQALRAEAVRLRAEALALRGELATAGEAAARALDLARRTPSPGALVTRARLTAARLRLRVGRRDEALLELRTLLEELRREGGPLERACRVVLASALLAGGDRGVAIEQASRALVRARERGDGLIELAALVETARCARHLGALDDAATHAAAAITLGTQRGANLPRAEAQLEAAAIAIDRDEREEAALLLDAGEATLRGAGALGLLPAALLVRASLGIARGTPDDAARAVGAAEEAYRLSGAQGDGTTPALALARAATARLTLGRREEAAEAADRAVRELELLRRGTAADPEVHFVHARTLAARRADGASAALERARAALDEQFAALDADARAIAEAAPLARAILAARL